MQSASDTFWTSLGTKLHMADSRDTQVTCMYFHIKHSSSNRYAIEHPPMLKSRELPEMVNASLLYRYHSHKSHNHDHQWADLVMT